MWENTTNVIGTANGSVLSVSNSGLQQAFAGDMNHLLESDPFVVTANGETFLDPSSPL